jgi:hypothetical protein
MIPSSEYASIEFFRNVRLALMLTVYSFYFCPLRARGCIVSTVARTCAGDGCAGGALRAAAGKFSKPINSSDGGERPPDTAD